MQNDLPEGETVGSDNDAAATSGVNSVCEVPELETPQVGGEQTQPESDNDDDGPVKKLPTETVAGQGENRVQQVLTNTQAGLVIGISGNGTKIIQSPDTTESDDLAPFVTTEELHSAKRTYKSLNYSDIIGYSGILLTHRILLLSCYDDDVALNVAKSIAYADEAATKRLVTIEKNCQGNYTLKNLIRQFSRSREDDGPSGRQDSSRLPETVWVWAAHNISEGDISHAILDSLFSSNAQVEQYQTQLSTNRLCLICLISPQRLQDYKRLNFKVHLQYWDVDFLCPMLEEYGQSRVEELAEIILEQRRQGKWDTDDAEFYKKISRHLSAGKLPEVVAEKAREESPVNLNVEQLFNRQDLFDSQDPLADTALYCATFYPDLSPQDFSQLVQLFLEDASEEVSESADRSQDGGEKVNAVTPPTLTQRWRRESDAIIRRCKLSTVTDENSRRVVDFQIDGLRSRLAQYIRDDHYFFYESKFVVMREQGLLFSPKKKIAEGARQLLVEMASQYTPDEVANWLYEIVCEFEQAAQAADLLRERSQLFHLIPDARVKAARRYVCHGLSLVLSRLNKEPALQEAARLFWQKLLQSERRWFLDLLRQMGNSEPAEILRWLKQVLDQGKPEIRAQAHGYLLGYLLRRDTFIYTTLKELTQWSPDGQAGRAMHTLLIVYCVETNRQLPQQDYGRWPSAHPLFGFQDHAEARECLEVLIGWVFTAAFEVDAIGGLSIVADIIAGWYLILSPPTQAEHAEAASTQDGADDLDARAVRQLLLECLARYCSRSQKNCLLATWENFRNDILEEVDLFEEFTGQLADISPSAKLMTDTAAARRKLLDTRASLGRLRRDFMDNATKVTHG